MKYKFGVKNCKSDLPVFWLYKDFPSAYLADRWAKEISFKKKNSMYLVWLIP